MQMDYPCCAAREYSRRLFNTTGKSCTKFLGQDYGPVPKQITGVGICNPYDRDHLLPYCRGPREYPDILCGEPGLSFWCDLHQQEFWLLVLIRSSCWLQISSGHSRSRSISLHRLSGHRAASSVLHLSFGYSSGWTRSLQRISMSSFWLVCIPCGPAGLSYRSRHGIL